jgi:hypothetical protein
MKKFLYFAIIAAGCFASSCDDMLTVKSPDSLTPENFWRNKSDAEKTLASSYAMLESATDYYGFSEVYWTVEAYREDLFELGADAFNYQEWVELYNFTYTNGNPKFSAYWANNYRGINRANQVISKVPNIPSKEVNEADKAELIAEAKFLRGYFHMKLLLNWEKIIIRDTYIQNESEFHKSLSSRDKTWDFIIADLQEATKLPATRNETSTGRATNGAAYSYLGYAYLTRAYEEPSKKNEYLQKAVEAFDKVKGYTLVKDIVSMFNGTNKNSSESIFEIQFSSNTENGASYTTTLHKWIASSELTGWDEILPNENLMNEYKKEGKVASTGRYDSRLYATIFFQDPYFNDGKGKVFGTDYDSTFCSFTKKGIAIPGTAYNKPSFRKYLPNTYEDLDAEGSSLNVPLMRYSNVLLMKAEALNELNKPAEAIPFINQVRSRADMPDMVGTTQAEVRAQIEHERILEFPLENFRFYDLRRWGKTKQALDAIGRTGFNVEKNSFYPIPQTELNSNNAL